uniref:Regulator of G protein signaling 3 n=1 Tax=Oryctolagus cuniculus TaxID=9986 RepID=A0A5F9D8T0_RABIT
MEERSAAFLQSGGGRLDRMFETEADEKREMPSAEGKGPAAEAPPPSKDPSSGQEPPPEPEPPLSQDPPSRDAPTCTEPTPEQEAPLSKNATPCQEPPLAQDPPPCGDLSAGQEPPPSQDALLSKDIPAIRDPPSCQGLPPSPPLLAETTGTGDPPAAPGAPPAVSRPAFVIPEVRLDSAYSHRAGAERGSSGEEEEDAEEAEEGEEGEEDEEEDTSDDNYTERSEAKRSSMIETGPGAEGGLSLRVQNSLRRRTHSEGSLLQEARGPCFSSDTTLHCSDGEGAASSWAIPSPRTLKKELGRNGGSMHHLSLFFTGHRKMSGDDDEASRKRKSKNLYVGETRGPLLVIGEQPLTLLPPHPRASLSFWGTGGEKGLCPIPPPAPGRHQEPVGLGLGSSPGAGSPGP